MERDGGGCQARPRPRAATKVPTLVGGCTDAHTVAGPGVPISRERWAWPCGLGRLETDRRPVGQNRAPSGNTFFGADVPYPNYGRPTKMSERCARRIQASTVRAPRPARRCTTQQPPASLTIILPGERNPDQRPRQHLSIPFPREGREALERVVLVPPASPQHAERLGGQAWRRARTLLVFLGGARQHLVWVTA